MAMLLVETSEEWLQRAVDRSLRTYLAGWNIIVPPIRIGVGFLSGGSRGGRQGETFPRARSKDGKNEVLVRTTLKDPVSILEALTQELVVASFDAQKNITKTVAFRDAMVKAVFLSNLRQSGRWHAGALLLSDLTDLAKALGDYPRSEGLNDTHPNGKQSTRMIKVLCRCGRRYGTTRKHLDSSLSLGCIDHSCVINQVTVG